MNQQQGEYDRDFDVLVRQMRYGSHTGIVFKVPTTGGTYTNLDLPSSETDMIISDIPDISEISNQSGGGETQWITNNLTSLTIL
jgi:hypothetical protein